MTLEINHLEIRLEMKNRHSILERCSEPNDLAMKTKGYFLGTIAK